MSEKPIIMSAPMVRAILAGAKTQTRRVAPISHLDIRTYPEGMVCWSVHFSKPVKGVVASHSGSRLSEDQARSIIASQFCPYGAPGTRLWVRETFVQGWPHGWDGTPAQFDANGDERPKNTWYRASSQELTWCADGETEQKVQWRPSIHMPRWASRIELLIKRVWAERLQDISEADAEAEGVERMPGPESYPMWRHYGTKGMRIAPASCSFRTLWQSINSAGSWDANPFVWCIEFERIKP